MEKSKLARIISMYGEDSLPRFVIEDKIATFEGMPKRNLYVPEVDYRALFDHYGLKPSNFMEKVAILTNPRELEKTNQDFHLNLVSSVDVKAANEGKINRNSFFQLAAIGIVKTKDNQILLGVRGGAINPERVVQYASGLYGLVPGGNVSFKPSYNVDPITDTLLAEAREEIGDFNFVSGPILGIFEAFRPGPTGIKFVGMLGTDATLRQIQKINIDANQMYQSMLLKGAKKKEAQAELNTRKLPVDAWEHTVILGLPNHVETINQFVNSQQQSFSGIGAGALDLYCKNPLNK